MDTSDFRNQENEADGRKRNGNEESNEHSEGEHSINGDDLLDITHEYARDGEVGRRLNQMVPVPVSLAFMPFYD